MQDLGEQLRRARLEKNLTLEEIYGQTKIQVRYLLALERNDPTPFAGEIYYKGALRNYARAVGLDPGTIMALYYELKQDRPPEKPPQSPPPEPASAPQRRLPPPKGLLWLLAAALIGALIWFALSRMPDRSLLPEDNTPPPVEEESPPLEPEIPNEVPSPQINIDTQQSTNTETAYIISGVEKLEVNLTFTGNCWVYLFSDGRELYQETYRAGQELSVEGKDKIWVRLGNPKGVKLSVNDMAIEGLQEEDFAHNYLFYMEP